LLWGGAGLLLVAPLVAMRFTSEMQWTGEDFVFAAVLLGTVGLAAELIVRMSSSLAYRAAGAAALAAAFAIILSNGAVGMIGHEGNGYNLYFYGVVLLALAGALAARFRAGGMALAMAAAGALQVALALGGYAVDPRGAVVSALLGGLWLLSAVLFRKAARDGAR
jgi:hypothetical protein